MKTKTLFWIMLYSLTGFTSFAQSQFTLRFQIDASARFITTDNFDNIYAVTEKNELLKYNSSGQLRWNYSNKSFGRLAFVDVTDPLRILLFYPALQQAVVLNNNLNEINRFNFADDPSIQITLISTANSNGYWAYDHSKRQLQKLGNQFNDEQLYGNIYQQTGIAVQPVYMLSTDQNIYLYDPQKGILQTDRFGSYLKTLKIDSVKSFQVKEDELLFLKDDFWQSMNISTNEIRKIYSFPNALMVSAGTKLLAVLTEKNILVYQMPTNDEKK